jgi:beta-galactosidase
VEQSGVETVMPDLPESVQASVRVGDGKRVLILSNFGETPQTIALPHAMGDVLHGGTVSSVTLAQYGVAVLQDEAKRQ